ncbi:hypothetical protein ACWGRV_23770 [Streptomyces sp. NPDC055663]
MPHAIRLPVLPLPVSSRTVGAGSTGSGAHFNRLYNRLAPNAQALLMADVETHAFVIDPGW